MRPRRRSSKSVDLVERSRFKNSFIFKYSARVGTKADLLMIDDVPEEVKKRRNAELLAVQDAISLADYQEFVGRTVEVLVEGPSKSATRRELAPGEFGQLTGRTTCDRIVVFDGPGRLIGRTLPVEVERASVVTLFGRVATLEVAGAGRRILSAERGARNGPIVGGAGRALVRRCRGCLGRPSPRCAAGACLRSARRDLPSRGRARPAPELGATVRLPPARCLESLARFSRTGSMPVAARLIHPLAALGPMVPFAAIPGLAMQPESWFELGNPNRETVCIDLGYRWPGGDFPLFTSGDDERRTRPQLIAPGFTAGSCGVLRRGGAEFWLDRRFLPRSAILGSSIDARFRLRRCSNGSSRSGPGSVNSCGKGVDDGLIAHELRLTRPDVELIVRHVQHAAIDLATIGADARP